jgi:type II secretory pathway component GspD/PulD (secretin)
MLVCVSCWCEEAQTPEPAPSAPAQTPQAAPAAPAVKAEGAHSEQAQKAEGAHSEQAQKAEAAPSEPAQKAEAPAEGKATGKKAQAQAGGMPLVSNSFFNTDVRQALADIAADAGVTILQDDTVIGYVNLDLKDTPLDRALRLMLMPLGLVYQEIEPGVWLVTAPDPKARSFPLIARRQVVPLTYVDPDRLLRLLPERFTPFVRVDADGRRVLVEAPQDMLQEVVDLIRSLDRKPGQVLIEALVLEANAATLSQWAPTLAGSHLSGDIGGGIFNYQSNPRNLPGSGGSSTTTTTPTTLYPTPGNIVGSLQMLLQSNQATLRANPRVIAPDGKPAEIEVGTQQYFSLLTGSAVYAYTRLERVDATIKLTISPRILPETGEIICDIEPSVADVVGQGTGGLPVITMRRAKSSIRLKDGQGIVIGGLLQETTSRSEAKLPVLGDIPLIGKLFRSSTAQRTKRDILFLISPHLLDDNGQFQGPLLSELLMNQRACVTCEEAAQRQGPPQNKGRSNSAPRH